MLCLLPRANWWEVPERTRLCETNWQPALLEMDRSGGVKTELPAGNRAVYTDFNFMPSIL